MKIKGNPVLTSKLKDNLEDLEPETFFFRGKQMRIILEKSENNNNHKIVMYNKDITMNGYQQESVSNLLIRLSVEFQKQKQKEELQAKMTLGQCINYLF